MLFIVCLLFALAFGLGAILGAPYLPVLRREHEQLLELCRLQPGQTLLDLGSGDGRLLKAAAKKGYRSIGYEINPFLFIISKIVTWPEREMVKIHLGDYWHTNLPPCDAIYVFLIDRYMPKLHRKLISEISYSTTVVSYIFAIPDKMPVATTRNAFVYNYGNIKA